MMTSGGLQGTWQPEFVPIQVELRGYFRGKADNLLSDSVVRNSKEIQD